MKKFKTFFTVLSLFVIVCVFVPCLFAEEEKQEDVSYTREISLFTGWGSGKLRRQENYEVVPLYLDIGYDIKPFLSEKLGFNPKGRFNFILEPFLGGVINPNKNVETGCDFLLKYSHPLTKRFFLYVEGGTGVMWTSQHTIEQGSQFNFADQVGGGISYLFCKNKAVNFGYRYRHFSNLNIEEPNDGVDLDYLLCGISILY